MRPIDTALAQRRFNRASTRGEDSRAIAAEVGDRLVERLAVSDIDPSRVLDAGCGRGAIALDFTRRYPSAQVIGADFAVQRLKPVRASRLSRRRKWSATATDLHQSSFADETFDLIVSNLALYWCRTDEVFAEFRRLLKPRGVLLFSLFGPDTLQELRSSFGDAVCRVMSGTDLHVVGDALLAAGFRDPVMDAEHLTFRYATLDGLLGDLRNAGWTNLHPDRPRSLGGRRTLDAMRQNYERLRVDGTLPATFEIVYGRALGPEPGQPRRTRDGAEATFSVDYLRRQIRK